MNLWIIARVTFLEVTRRKILWTALLAAVAFLALFGTGVHYQELDLRQSQMNPLLRYQIFATILQVGFYAVDMLAVIMTVLISVDTISGEIASSTIHAMATKPLARWEILIGKWLGYACMVGAFVGIAFGGVVAIGHFIAHVVPRGAWQGALLIYFECLVVLSATFLFGTWFTTLTNGVIVLGMHGIAFIGGWLEQIGAVTHSTRLIDIGIISSLILPTEAIWRRAAYVMQGAVARTMDFSPFGARSAPSGWMLAYAGLYLVACVVLALRRFRRRDL